MGYYYSFHTFELGDAGVSMGVSRHLVGRIHRRTRQSETPNGSRSQGCQGGQQPTQSLHS
jgi:hypothetical protein